ncbi:FtsX-like permease family protein [Candidatus Uhrbacteria bacterium]|nr:FtsX-like permease family protein [Candidatus Uhrbacteria bacterium]
MFISTYRVTKFAFQNFWRNFWLSVITITMLVMTLLTVNILIILNFVTNQAIQTIEDRVEISVYFHGSAPQTTIDNAVDYLRSLSQVKDVQTVSAQESLDRFILIHKQDEAIVASLEEIGGNPFGPSLIVKAQNVSDFDFILKALENPKFSDSIRQKDFSNYSDVVTRIKNTTDRVRTFGVALSVIFLLIAILIVFNTVRMSIFIHREEIGIMKLVGASDRFVRAPFFLEMILLSLISIFVILLIVYPLIAIFEPKFGFFIGGESIGLVNYFEQNGLMIFGLEFVGLVLLTLFSTGLAMRKYLKV